jgi:hypothetical protein
MAATDTPRQLHDRATRGEPLSVEEQAKLTEWYAQQDREESEMLSPPAPSTDVDELRLQVENALARLAALTRRVQGQASENEAVRKEILALQQQLAERSTTQPA